MDLQKFHRLHFIGIGGMGMRALAEILIEKGMHISGSDMKESDYLDFMRKQGAEIFVGHEAAHVEGADGVVISSAISKENPELAAARQKGIPVYHRSDVLAAMFHWGRGIAVAGGGGERQIHDLGHDRADLPRRRDGPHHHPRRRSGLSARQFLPRRRGVRHCGSRRKRRVFPEIPEQPCCGDQY